MVSGKLKGMELKNHGDRNTQTKTYPNTYL